jgi:hypothetical protein
VVEGLPSIHKALGSIPSTRKEGRKERWEGGRRERESKEGREGRKRSQKQKRQLPWVEKRHVP